jgi:hypothetical protein
MTEILSFIASKSEVHLIQKAVEELDNFTSDSPQILRVEDYTENSVMIHIKVTSIHCIYAIGKIVGIYIISNNVNQQY